MPAYRSQAELEIVAVADVSAARREAAARALPHARIYSDHGSLLAAEAARLDFIDVTAPPYSHAPIARAALEHGLHVLCEKPLAICVEDVRELCALAESKRCVLFPSHNYKHAPVIRAVDEILQSGAIGKVHMLTLATFRNTHARGVREWNEHWRRQRRYSGGGIAMDHGSHTFYLAFAWLGAYPTSITAKMAAADGFDTEDNFHATLTFPTGIASAQLSWTAGVRKVVYTIHGERGALRVEDDDVELSIMQDGGAGWERTRRSIASAWMDASHAGWFASLFERFVAAMDDRTYIGRDTIDALHCISVINTAYTSARDGSREYALEVAE